MDCFPGVRRTSRFNGGRPRRTLLVARQPLHRISSRRKLQKIDAAAGFPQTISDFPGRWGGGGWNLDDVIVFADLNVGLFRVPASGGVPVQITALDPARQENRHFGASFLPDGRHFLYTRTSNILKNSAIYLGSIDARPEQQSSKPVMASGWQPMFVASGDPGIGYMLFVRGRHADGTTFR